MAQKYAKDQPAGFTNRIERVAVIGAGGQIGQHIAEEIIRTGKHSVTVITRPGSTSAMPAGAKVVHADYADEAAMVAALTDQQFLIISLSVFAPKETHHQIVAAAAEAGVPYVMPNAYGGDFTNEALARESMHGSAVQAVVNDVEAQGVAWIALACGFWYEFSLSLGPDRFNFDWPNRRVKFYDDGTTKINTSTWLQCGRAVAALLSLKELPEDGSDRSPAIANWRNKPLYIASFTVSQRDMLDSVNRVMGRTDADWEIVSEPSPVQYAAGIERMKQGDMAGFGIAMYARCFYPNGGGNFGATIGLSNDVLGLPEDDLDEATRRAVQMVETEYRPGAAVPPKK